QRRSIFITPPEMHDHMPSGFAECAADGRADPAGAASYKNRWSGHEAKTGQRCITGSGNHIRYALSRGTFLRSSSSQTSATASDGARHSPRGLSAPPEETFGPLGLALRLSWLNSKKRRRKCSSQRAIVAGPHPVYFAWGKSAGQMPSFASRQACQARNATFDGFWPKRMMWWRKKSLSS